MTVAVAEDGACQLAETADAVAVSPSDWVIQCHQLEGGSGQPHDGVPGGSVEAAT